MLRCHILSIHSLANLFFHILTLSKENCFERAEERSVQQSEAKVYVLLKLITCAHTYFVAQQTLHKYNLVLT